MNHAMRSIAAVATGALLALTAGAGAASAAALPDPLPTVVSAAGVVAVQLAPAGATDSEVEQAILAYQRAESRSPQARTASPLATPGYYSYCQEGSSGLMVWTNNKPYNCYGWYYEYQNGSRLSKINMLKLKAYSDSVNPALEWQLKQWCDSNGTYCTVATAIVSWVGKYLWTLLYV